MNNTVFISSTFEDLKEHRAKVWDLLAKYNVNIRGMEKFGARTEAPLETCLAEVEQSDIFVGIIGYRLGKVDSESSKSFVQLEYEKALSLKKEIFLYLLDDKTGHIIPALTDFGEPHNKLEAFKSILKERHVIDTFKDEADLVEKLKRKFDVLLTKEADGSIDLEDDYEKSNNILQKFLLLPNVYSNKEVKLKIKIKGKAFPASKSLCKDFSLRYGATIGLPIELMKPNIMEDAFAYLFIDSNKVEQFFKLNTEKNNEIEIYASPQFSSNNIENIRANFVSVSYININSLYPSLSLHETRTIPAEGQIILLLKDIINDTENNISKLKLEKAAVV